MLFRSSKSLMSLVREARIKSLLATIKESVCNISLTNPSVLAYCEGISPSTSAKSTAPFLICSKHSLIIIYYDNGQIELTKILTSVFNTLYAHVEFRKVKPVDYKLFQAADLICTMELLAEKADSNSFSRSEREFFCSVRDFKKNYFKPLLKKHL